MLTLTSWLTTHGPWCSQHQCNRRKQLGHTLTVAAGVLDVFEKKLRQLNPNLPTITYEFKDFAAYIDAIVSSLALGWSAGTTIHPPLQMPPDLTWPCHTTAAAIKTLPHHHDLLQLAYSSADNASPAAA
jgi:hypothetical protein